MIELLVGLVVGIGIIVLGKSCGFENDRGFYPILLIVIALYYVLFAFQRMVWVEIATETLVAVLFSMLALGGHQRKFMLVGLGLILHGMYDIFHQHLPLTTEAPQWWPLFCFGVDVVLGGWFLREYKNQHDL